MSVERTPIALTVDEWNEKAGLLHSIRTEGTKMGYAIQRIFESVETQSKAAKKDYDSSVDDLRVKHAKVFPDDHPQVEKRGVIVRDEQGNLSFTKEATLLFQKEVRDLNDEFLNRTLTLIPYFAQPNWQGFDEVPVSTHNKLVGILFESEIIEEEPDEEVAQPKFMEVVRQEPQSEQAPEQAPKEEINAETEAPVE